MGACDLNVLIVLTWCQYCVQWSEYLYFSHREDIYNCYRKLLKEYLLTALIKFRMSNLLIFLILVGNFIHLIQSTWTTIYHLSMESNLKKGEQMKMLSIYGTVVIMKSQGIFSVVGTTRLWPSQCKVLRSLWVLNQQNAEGHWVPLLIFSPSAVIIDSGHVISSHFLQSCLSHTTL